MTPRTRLLHRLQGYATAALILGIAGLLATLSIRHDRVWDWTAAQRHTLSVASLKVIEKLNRPVTVTAYVREDQALRDRITYLVDRYRRAGADIRIEFVNPDTAPDRVRDAGIRLDGELVVGYDGRDRHVEVHTEQALTNALATLARDTGRWAVFARGHGERSPEGQANHDLGAFAGHLGRRGITVQPLELAQTGAIADNTSVLVIASPLVDWLPAEVRAVQDHVRKGGNLLLLIEPGNVRGLGPLLDELGIAVTTGTVVDPTTQRLGIEHPAMALVLRYPPQPATQGFDLLTVFPFAAALKATPPEGWAAASLLQTADAAWSETAALEGNVAYDEGADFAGPLDIGIAMTRVLGADQGGREQRVIVIGDGDFLANSYLGNSGNLDLGLRLLTWLGGDDELIDIPARTAPDATLELSRAAQLLIGFGFLFGLPLLLAATGGTIWYRRRQR
jgi:ABC-type uncharacterized transport system involved in gliding motility auxiliary subunit